jgi:drug/metabolite transporter (DMT)-like permease
MSFRDFWLFAAVCLVWAVNTVISKIIITDYGVPPLFYGAARFLLVAVAVCPFLFPAPRPLWRLIAISLCMGGGAFALSFIGLQTASPSAAAIVWQLGLPLTTLLSVLVLGERIHWRRGVGIAMTFAGVIMVMWRPHDLVMSTGLLWIAASTVANSAGAVMMKQMEGVPPLRFQAWVGLISFAPLAILSPLTEPRAIDAAFDAGWVFWAALVFSALVSSVIGHTLYYWMIQKYEANLVAPLSLMVPLFTMGLGVVVTGDIFDARMALGSTVALLGVLVIAIRRNHVAPLLLLLRLRA